MADIENCEYDRPVVLEKNSFRRNSLITLYQDGQKNPAETTNMTVKHKFMGWSTQKNGVVRYTDGETVKKIADQNGTVTLYAVWSEEAVTLPSLAAPMGYHFLGWAKAADAQTGLMQMDVTDSAELYAVWKRDIVKYHVEYYKENLAGGYDLASSYQFDGYTDDEVSVDSIDKVSPGFALDESSSKLSGRIKADGSLILCAYYRRNSYEFQYDLNGGRWTKAMNFPESVSNLGQTSFCLQWFLTAMAISFRDGIRMTIRRIRFISRETAMLCRTMMWCFMHSGKRLLLR